MRLRDKENIYVFCFQDLVNMYTGKLGILETIKTVDTVPKGWVVNKVVDVPVPS